MKRIMPVAGTPLSVSDLFKSVTSQYTIDQFSERIKQLFGVNHCFFVNSGTTAFHIILQTLKKLYPQRNEVILPAYTAPSMGMVLKKTGLEVKLVDISLDDFTMSLSAVGSNISQNTLCIVPTHLFGIPCNISRLKEIIGNEISTIIVEDLAQAVGSKIKNQISTIKNPKSEISAYIEVSAGRRNPNFENEWKLVGASGDIGFFSLARGKNITTYTGGCLITNNDQFASILKEEINSLPQTNFLYHLQTMLKILILSQAVKPEIYSILYPLVSKFKSDTVPEDFMPTKYSDLQSRFGITLLNHLIPFSEKRYQNGIKLIQELNNIPGILLPQINQEIEPAFNRLPIVFKDLSLRERIENNLFVVGIETSRFYLQPLHRIFDFSYKKDEFPNATYLAEHLLTLPVHPLVTEKDIETIVKVFKQ